MIGRIRCWFSGHLRRKLVSDTPEARTVACPRCGDTLVYKKTKAAA